MQPTCLLYLSQAFVQPPCQTTIDPNLSVDRIPYLNLYGNNFVGIKTNLLILSSLKLFLLLSDTRSFFVRQLTTAAISGYSAFAFCNRETYRNHSMFASPSSSFRKTARHRIQMNTVLRCLLLYSPFLSSSIQVKNK